MHSSIFYFSRRPLYLWYMNKLEKMHGSTNFAADAVWVWGDFKNWTSVQHSVTMIMIRQYPSVRNKTIFSNELGSWWHRMSFSKILLKAVFVRNWFSWSLHNKNGYSLCGIEQYDLSVFMIWLGQVDRHARHDGHIIFCFDVLLLLRTGFRPTFQENHRLNRMTRKSNSQR